MPRIDWAAMGLHPRGAHPSRLVLNHPPIGDQGREGLAPHGHWATALWAYWATSDSKTTGRNRVVRPPSSSTQPRQNGAYSSACSEGAYLGRVMGFVPENGVCSLELMPYNQGDCGIRPTDQAKDDAAHYWIKYAKIDGSNPEEFRNAIASGHPVVISIPMTPEFRKTWRLGRDWVEDPDKTSNFWHAVCVIGYDDTREAYSPGADDDRYKGRLIVQNSWGHQGGFPEGGKHSGLF